MKRLLARLSAAVCALFGAILLLPVRAAASLNPHTGDPTSRIMGWIFIALGVSLIAIIVLFVVLGKNRKE